MDNNGIFLEKKKDKSHALNNNCSDSTIANDEVVIELLCNLTKFLTKENKVYKQESKGPRYHSMTVIFKLFVEYLGYAATLIRDVQI